ncbi:MAG: MMPL family transporter [Gordonia sp. (in: high G+C Gram-positive bacteria)]|uniref:MMPL family transporter n=1 Tax=Gordonia sp. (in: high G+C Gram-positive bacteria) TaxID=84139 RepID=UPI0039E2BBA9
MSAGLKDRDTAAEAIKELRSINKEGLHVYVAGTPALTQDSIDSLMHKLPLMAVMLVLVTGLLMFLAFGSVILPIKAALMSALGLGSTLGILTWMFVDESGPHNLLNYTPGPLFAAMLVLIIAIVYGLSTDYEIFLLSRMVEARQQGASTTEAIRTGTAHTGRIITAAAAILVVVTGAFGLSDIVMMKYIAFGMISALILDATVIRMLLVPSIMKLLGDDCWWSPRWMLKLQRKLGLGETILEDEPEDKVVPVAVQGATSAGGVVAVAEAPTTAMKASTPRVSTKDVDDERPAAGLAAPRGLRALARRDRNDAAASEPIEDDDHLAEGHLEDLDLADDPDVDDDPQAVGPDTGSWRLGAGGVRLGSRDLRPRPAPAPQQAPVPPQQQPVARPQAPQAPVPPQSRPQPVPPRPAPGARPVPPQAPQPAPQQQAPAAPVPPAPQPAPPAAPVPRGGYLASTPPPQSPSTPAVPPQYGRPNAARELTGDRDDQISVQDLLRRSRGQDSAD